MFTEDDIKAVIEAYEKRGIVTREDFINLDSRPLSEEVLDELYKMGYNEAMITEAHLEYFKDYSSAIFDSNRYKPDEADKYLIHNVLHF